MEMNETRLEAQDLNQQGALLLKMGNLEGAKAKFDKALDFDPMLMDTYKNYGDLYMALQEYQEAKNSYKKAMLIEKNGLLHFLYGNACFMNDELHEGLENYNMAISEGYDSDEMMFFMGMAYEHMNDDNMALRYFQKACVKNPSRPDYLIKKISALIRLHMLDSASDATEVLLKTSPEMYDGYHIKTQLLIHQNNIDGAIAFSKSASDKFPEDADLMFDYIKCVALSHDYPKALSLITSAKQMKYYEDAKHAFVILQAEVAAESNNYDLAMSSCKKCIEMETDGFFDSEARFMLMNMELIDPGYDKALEQAIALVSNNAEDNYYYAALYYKAFCYKHLDKQDESKLAYKEANSIYRLATLKNPAAVDVYLYRAMVLKDIEEYDKALEILDFLLGISTEIAEVYSLKADIFRTLGKHLQADEQMKIAYRLKPELKPAVEKAGD